MGEQGQECHGRQGEDHKELQREGENIGQKGGGCGCSEEENGRQQEETLGGGEAATQEHLGSYSSLISAIPGISNYFDTKFEITE